MIIAAAVSFGVGLLERKVSIESIGIESIGIVVAIPLAIGLVYWNESKANAGFAVLNTSWEEAESDTSYSL